MKDVFSVLHEAVTTVDPKLIRDVYLKKKAQRYSKEKIFSHLSRICDVSICWYPTMSKTLTINFNFRILISTLR